MDVGRSADRRHAQPLFLITLGFVRACRFDAALRDIRVGPFAKRLLGGPCVARVQDLNGTKAQIKIIARLGRSLWEMQGLPCTGRWRNDPMRRSDTPLSKKKPRRCGALKVRRPSEQV